MANVLSPHHGECQHTHVVLSTVGLASCLSGIHVATPFDPAVVQTWAAGGSTMLLILLGCCWRD
jgi:hypothetical protein